jgi:hypothetical protein
MPELGHPEATYLRRIRRAEAAGDTLARDAYKVAQYITLALNPALTWPEKLRYFTHTLHRHCVPPEWPEESIWMFYQSLANLVRENAGLDALRLASAEDDIYAARLGMGATREKIENDAEEFFAGIVGFTKPDWFNEGDYQQLVLLRDQWV